MELPQSEPATEFWCKCLGKDFQWEGMLMF